MVDISKMVGNAISAYANTAKIATGQEGAAQGMEARDNKGGESFFDLIKQGVQNVADTQRASEQMAAKAVEGKADLNDVIQAVTDAEITLQTVVTIRDRMISAYQEIMRMPI